MQKEADVFSITQYSLFAVTQPDLGALSIDVGMGGNSTVSTFL